MAAKDDTMQPPSKKQKQGDTAGKLIGCFGQFVVVFAR